MRKDSLRKNAVVLTVLVLVGAAVFINWKFSPPAETANSAVSGEESGRKLLGQSTHVSGEGDSSADPAGEDAVYTGTDLKNAIRQRNRRSIFGSDVYVDLDAAGVFSDYPGTLEKGHGENKEDETGKE